MPAPSTNQLTASPSAWRAAQHLWIPLFTGMTATHFPGFGSLPSANGFGNGIRERAFSGSERKFPEPSARPAGAALRCAAKLLSDPEKRAKRPGLGMRIGEPLPSPGRGGSEAPSPGQIQNSQIKKHRLRLALHADVKTVAHARAIDRPLRHQRAAPRLGHAGQH